MRSPMRKVHCPECRDDFELDESQLARPVTCPACSRRVLVLPLGIWDELADRPRGAPLEAARRGIVLDQIRSEHNVGSMFRTADATGWPRVYLTGVTPVPLAKTALGAHEWVEWSYRPDVIEVLDALGEAGVRRVALEVTEDSVPVHELALTDRPTVLVVGNEVAGVSPQALRRVDDVVHLPMAGRKSSLNVAVALGAALYLLNAA